MHRPHTSFSLLNNENSPLLAACLIFSAALISGCQNTQEQMLYEGYPPTYVDGLDAGCSSGRHAGGGLEPFRKDVRQYMNDSLYKMGWEDGLSQCKDALQAEEDRIANKPTDEDNEWRRHVKSRMGEAFSKKKQLDSEH